MYERILTVCTGNICRSPVAEALLRLQLAADGRDAQVRSAGVRALVGKPVDETALFVASDRGSLRQELEGHRAQQLNSTLTWWADLILVMEPRHLQHVVRLDPAAQKKVHLLGRFTQHSIPDPYLKHELEYRDVQTAIEKAVASWRDTINR